MPRTLRAALVALLAAALIAPLSAAAGAQTPAGTFWRVNFQTETAAPAPYHAESAPGAQSTYLRDWGQAYGARTAGGQGSGLSYGWVAPGTTSARSLIGNGRERGVAGLTQRLDTLVHMQPLAASGGAAGSWEIALPDGQYTVTVGVGDPSYTDSTHALQVEGVAAITGFEPSATTRFATASRHVTLTDGRLTVSATGGTNTKLAYLEIYAGTRPYVTRVSPLDGATGVSVDAAVSTDVQVVGTGSGVAEASLTSGNVRLVEAVTGQPVAATRGTSGGNDVISLDPNAPLKANTQYRFEVDYEVLDEAGTHFMPFWSTFTTGSVGEPATDAIFTEEPQTSASGRFYTGVTMGPDGRLYAGTADGDILRFPVAANGTLGTPTTISSLRTAEGGDRLLIGLAFDPTSPTPKLWVSHTTFGYSDMPDWGGKISTLTGTDLGTVTTEVTDLPRSAKDHVTNGLAFGPDGFLYVSQGANTAGGAADPQWGNRDERLLSAAILKVDTARLSSIGTLNVRTEEGGSYDPFAANQPVTLHATGVRNAYDLVWHRNGQLYTAINGTAGGAISPATPNPLPAECEDQRIDGSPYTGPQVPGIGDLPTQPDLAARVQAGGYYGNPNPTRCEWVINGGNPTAGPDELEVVQVDQNSQGYPVGVQPDRNWRPERILALGTGLSPNGIIEYRRSQVPEIDRQLLVVAYSNCNCVYKLTLNGAGDVTGKELLRTSGSVTLDNPLDLIQGPGGVVYVTDRANYGLDEGRITLLRPPG